MTPRGEKLLRGAFQSLLILGAAWLIDILERNEMQRALCRWEDDGGPPAPDHD